MKYSISVILTILSAQVFAIEVRQLTVKKINQDVYQTVGYGINRAIIQTEYCSESAFYDTPVTLVYDKYNTHNNKLVFSNGRQCRVKSVYVETR